MDVVHRCLSGKFISRDGWRHFSARVALLAFLSAGSALAAPPTVSPIARLEQPTPGQVTASLAYQYQRSDQRFSTTGTPETASNGLVRSSHTGILTLHYGVSARTSVHLELPLLYPQLTNSEFSTGSADSSDSEGASTVQGIQNPLPALGDMAFSLRRSLTQRPRSPLYGASLELLARLPTGLTHPGDPGSIVLTGTGVAELEAAGIYARSVVPGVSVDVQLRVTQPLSDVVAYAVDPETGGDGRLFPGARAQGALLVRVEPMELLGLGVGASVTHHGQYWLGGTDASWLPVRGLEPLAGTEGLFGEARAQVGLHVPGKPVSLVLDARYLFLGRTHDAFSALALDRFSPPPGLRGGAAVWLLF